MKEQVLKAMREAGKPVSAGEVTKALGADRKEIDKVLPNSRKKAPSSPPSAANGSLPNNAALTIPAGSIPINCDSIHWK